MMSRLRRTFTREFKSKVILEALREKNTLEVLGKKHELLPSQISTWKAEAVKNILAVFEPDKVVVPKDDISVEQLYTRIEQLTLRNDFLK